MTKRIGLSSLGFAAALLISSPAPRADSGRRAPDTISLPDGFRPEGIAIGRGSTIYAGSIPTGAIFAANLRTGEGSILVPPQEGRAAIGLEFDRRTDLIYVAGGPTGSAFVYDAETGETVAVFRLTTATPTFVNDQIVTRDAVYFTDSQRPVIYRIPLGRRGRLSPDAPVQEIALGGDFQFVPGAFNSNGIEATRDGRELILVNSAAATLYRVDPEDGFATAIDLGGTPMTNGDGLLLRGDRLFVVQNQLNQIAVVDLSRCENSGEVVDVITSPRFDVPTTIAATAGSIYVVNARFSTPPTPETTYTIERVRLHR
jgi:sugar lactone lactonase YvrE